MPDAGSIHDLIEQARTHERSGQVTAAFQNAQQALKLAREIGDPGLTASALVESAKVYFRMGLYDEARQKAEEGLSLESSDDLTQANAWQVLANCAAETDSLRKAETFYYRAATLARKSGDERALMASLHGLATGVYIPQGFFELAQAAELEVVNIARSEKTRENMRYPLISLAMIDQITGRVAGAHQALTELSSQIEPHSLFDGYRLCLEGTLALDEGYIQPAGEWFSKARSVAEASGEPWLNINVRMGMSRLNRLSGEASTALMWAEDAVSYAQRVGYRHETGKAMIERAQALWQCGAQDEAVDQLSKSAELLGSLGANYDLAHCQLIHAGLLHQKGSPQSSQVFTMALKAILSGGYAFLVEKERRLAIPMMADVLNHPDKHLVHQTNQLLEHLKRIPAPALKIILLGGFEVYQSGKYIDKRYLRQRQADKLLALLLLSPGYRLQIEEIYEMLWPEKPPDSAQVALHHATSSLRRALEPDLPDKFPSRYLEMDMGWLKLHLPPGSTVDLEHFEAHLQREEIQNALEVYGGELLPEFQYASWTILQRQRAALLYQRALYASAMDHFSRGCFQGTLEPCQRLIDLEPWHEEAVLLAMRACQALNDLSTARHLYLALEKRLREELNTHPQEELRDLYHSLTPEI